MQHHPYSSVLRQRAADLRDVAARIERSAVATLDDPPTDLARRLLDANLRQLRLACDDLRDAAFRCSIRADELDLAVA